MSSLHSVDEKEKFTKMDKGKFLLPRNTAAGNNNSVLDRVKSFLPQLAKANATLQHDQSTLDPTQLSLKYNVEDIPESTPKVIEMVSIHPSSYPPPQISPYYHP